MSTRAKVLSVLGLILALLAIACTVAAVVYRIESRRRELYEEKWQDYDECGVV